MGYEAYGDGLCPFAWVDPELVDFMAFFSVENVDEPVVAAADDLAALVRKGDLPHPGLLSDRNLEGLHLAKPIIFEAVDADSVNGVREAHGAVASVNAGIAAASCQFLDKMHEVSSTHMNVPTFHFATTWP